MRTSVNGQRGFSILELLVMLSVMGLMAAVVIPNATTFLGAGNLAAASDELQNVKTAELGYLAEYHDWPSDSTALTGFLTSSPRATYFFDPTTGFVKAVSGVTWSRISWIEPPGPPYSQDGKWTK